MTCTCCEFLVGGAPPTPPVPPSALCGTPICINKTTVDATPVVIPIGTLGVVGAAITFRIRLDGQQDNGERGLYFAPEGDAARSAVGSGIGTPIFIGPVGYTDAVFVPWTTLGVPVGWTATLAVVATVLQLSFNAAALQTVHWRGMIERWAHNGAILA